MIKIPASLNRDDLIDAIHDLTITDSDFLGFDTKWEVWETLDREQQRKVLSYLDY